MMVMRINKLMIMLLLVLCINVPILVSDEALLVKIFSILVLGTAIVVTIIRVMQIERIKKLKG